MGGGWAPFIPEIGGKMDSVMHPDLRDLGSHPRLLAQVHLCCVREIRAFIFLLFTWFSFLFESPNKKGKVLSTKSRFSTI